MSSSPAMIMKGTLAFCWLRIFFCIRSEEASTSTRSPFFRAFAANSWR